MKLLSQVKKEIEFNQGLYSLIEILKQISMTQFHILEKKVKSFDDLFLMIGSLLDMVDIGQVKSAHPLLNLANRQAAVIAVTSDSGLLGGLNLQVLNLAIKDVIENHAKLIIIGERGKLYASESNISFVAFEGVKDETRYQQALALRNYIIDEELQRKIGPLKIIYPQPISVVAQEIRSTQLLPFSKSTYIKDSAQAKPGVPSALLLESSIEDVIEYLIFLLLGHKFHEIFGLSRLAELSARFVHLEDSRGKIEQLNKELRLQYLRQRHEIIDRSMRELFAARLAFQ